MKHLRRTEQRKFQYIYKISRADGSGRYYIGRHSTDNLDDGYFGSGTRITRSVKKYGKEGHVKEILEFLPSYEALKLREKELINEELLGDILCMNIAPGGHGGKTSAQVKELWARPEFREKMLRAFSRPEYREKMDINRQKATLAAASPESNKKRINTFESIKHQQGQSNSQFGTCWITKDGTPLRIKKEALSEYIEKGFTKGRK